jgi:serine/threonine protein phosphatase 1
LSKLFDRLRRKKAQEPKAPRYPDGARMYCIGDIHGRADLLQELHDMIEEDAADYQGKKQLLYVGDYIDRGSTSREVLDMLLDEPLQGFEVVYLKGNHEQALLDFLKYPGATAGWLVFGGRETLVSYGVQTKHVPGASDFGVLAQELDEQLPERHRAFYQDSLLSWQAGDYYFVHAGIRPGVALDEQHFEDQLWIRDDFINSEKDHGVVVVHGHTVFEEVQFRPNRIGIDTGAYQTGVLTALVLEGTERRLLQTGQ